MGVALSMVIPSLSISRWSKLSGDDLHQLEQLSARSAKEQVLRDSSTRRTDGLDGRRIPASCLSHALGGRCNVFDVDAEVLVVRSRTCRRRRRSLGQLEHEFLPRELQQGHFHGPSVLIAIRARHTELGNALRDLEIE